jgi:hypothetical protein
MLFYQEEIMKTKIYQHKDISRRMYLRIEGEIGGLDPRWMLCEHLPARFGNGSKILERRLSKDDFTPAAWNKLWRDKVGEGFKRWDDDYPGTEKIYNADKSDWVLMRSDYLDGFERDDQGDVVLDAHDFACYKKLHDAWEEVFLLCEDLDVSPYDLGIAWEMADEPGWVDKTKKLVLAELRRIEEAV